MSASIPPSQPDASPDSATLGEVLAAVRRRQAAEETRKIAQTAELTATQTQVPKRQPPPAALAQAALQSTYVVDAFPALPWRGRLLVVLATLATSGFVISAMLGNPGGTMGQFLPAADAPRCGTGQQDACVGGTVQVIVVPQSAASAALPTAPPGTTATP